MSASSWRVPDTGGDVEEDGTALEEGKDVVVEGRLEEAGDIVTVVVELPGNHEEEDGATGSKGDEEAEALAVE